MRIASFLKNSFIDYPKKTAAVVFTPGCNFLCPFCHNAELVHDSASAVDEQEFFDFLDIRKQWLDGVCITGGEPTLHADLDVFCKKIRAKGFLVKLDTNGTSPEMVKKLISEHCIDMIAVDIKHVFHKYPLACGVSHAADKVRQTVDIIRRSDVQRLFRTTVVPFMHEVSDIAAIRSILDNEPYSIQSFRPGSCLNSDFNEIEPFTSEQWHEFQHIVNSK